MRRLFLIAMLCAGASASMAIGGCHADPHDTHVTTTLVPARL
jgi:metal-dependent amidase/aminoacylase/carboxypeptidase family protein